MVAGATAGTRQKLSILTSSSSDISSDNTASTGGHRITQPHPVAQSGRGTAAKETGMCTYQCSVDPASPAGAFRLVLSLLTTSACLLEEVFPFQLFDLRPVYTSKEAEQLG